MLGFCGLLKLTGCEYLVGARHPRAFAEYALYILGVDHLALYERACQLVVAFGMLPQDLLSAFVLLVDYAAYFGIDLLGTVVAVWL